MSLRSVMMFEIGSGSGGGSGGDVRMDPVFSVKFHQTFEFLALGVKARASSTLAGQTITGVSSLADLLA